MTPESYRAQSLSVLAENGLAVTELPLLDRSPIRRQDEVMDRLLCLHSCAAAAYGFPKEHAMQWAEKQGLSSALEDCERDFLTGNTDATPFKLQIESMLAFHWALGFEQKFDLFAEVDTQFVLRMPDLKIGESAASMLSRAKLKPEEDLMQAADTLYCLHWIVRDSALLGRPKILFDQVFVISARRQALDWIFGDDSWSDVSLNT